MSKTRSKHRLSKGFLLLFSAVIFLIGGILFYSFNGKYKKDGIKTDAVITEINSYYVGDTLEHDVKVEFTVNGVKYGGSLNTYTSSMRVNKIVPVYYMPENPYDFSYGKLMYLPMIALEIGAAVCLAFAIVFFVSNATNNADRSKLTEKYTRTETIIREAKIFYNTLINGQNPITLVCSDSLNNTYKKKFLYDGSVDFTVGDKIDVYVKKNNPKKYLIDVNGYREQKTNDEELQRIDTDF